MNVYSRDETERFRLLVEQLEVCRELVLAGSAPKARMALILLDNLAEVILYRLSARTLDRDTAFKWVVPERFSTPEKRKIDRGFDAKLELAKVEYSLLDSTVTILQIAHSYRNAAFHRDTHNPAVVTVLSLILLKGACDLFVQTQGGLEVHMTGCYKTPLHWLERYGLANTFIEYGEAAQAVASQISTNAEPDLDTVRGAFAADISSRTTELRRLIEDELPWKSPDELNPILKRLEVKDVEPHLEDSLSESYRNHIYKIAAGEPVDVTPEELNEIEKSFRQEYESRLSAYKQQVRSNDIEPLSQRGRGLNAVTDLRILLQTYYEIDSDLSRLERYMDLAFQEWEHAVQSALDRQRGK